MARRKSEGKRAAILEAATEVFAELGLGAATSGISSAAGVAEGTLFTYFKTKDELVNSLYREIKISLAEAMLFQFPRKKSVRLRFQHIWEHYVEWGVANPMPQKVLKQIEVWGGLTEASKAAGLEPFAEIQTIIDDAKRQRIAGNLSQSFVGAMMNSLAETTMQFVREDPKRGRVYRDAGFRMLWTGITLKT